MVNQLVDNDARTRLEHPARLLRAIRNIDQLIVREKDPERLIQQACEMIVDARDYDSAWIVLGDPGEPPRALARAGLADRQGPIERQLREGSWPSRRELPAVADGGLAVLDPREAGWDLPAAAEDAQDLVATVALRHEGDDFGFLSVSFPRDAPLDDEETSLLLEVAGAIAFALHDIDIDRRMREFEAENKALYDQAPVLLLLVDGDRRIRKMNRRAAEMSARIDIGDLRGGEALRCVHSLDDARGCGFGINCQFCTIRAAILDAVERGREHRQVPVTLRVRDGSGEEQDVYFMVSTSLVTSGGVRMAQVCLLDVTDLKRADESRIAESRRAQQYLDIAGVIIVVINRDGVVTLINQKGCEVLGYSEDEIVGRNWFDSFLPPEIRAEILKVSADLFAGTVETAAYAENPVLTRSGEERLIAWNNTVVRDGAGNIIAHLSSGEDITERKRLEMERRDAQNETEALLCATRSVLLQPDLPSAARAILDICAGHIGAPTGCCIFWNRAGKAAEVLSFGSDEWPPGVDPGLPAFFGEAMTETYRQGRAVYQNDCRSSAVRGELSNGQLELESALFAPVVLDREAVGMIGLANKPGGFSDKDARMAEAFGETMAISLREHRTREELRKNRAHLEAVFDSTADNIMLLGEAHRVQMINRADSGRAQEQILGTPLCDLVDPDDRERVKTLLDEVARHRESRTYDTTYRRSDGTATCFNSIASPVVSSGESMGIVVVSRDMTEQKKMEAQLAQADRLSSMGVLAAGVAHEINNPLSYVLYNLRSLHDDLPGLLEDMRAYQARLNAHLGRAAVETIVGSVVNGMNPAMFADIQERLRDALTGTQRIRDIAKGLGTFSRVEAEQVVPVNLVDVIEAALSMCFNELKYRARVVKDYGKTPTVIASEGRLSQVFLNLFVNAAHAIDEGDVAANEIRVRTWAQGDTICAEVRDTGSGIDPRHLDKLFEPFFSTKETGVGSGLGLPISKGIVEGYGGTISVESELGVGTSVQIRLPARVEEAPPAASAEIEEDQGRVHGRILVVDDEEGMRTAMVRMLRDHETVLASTGEAAKGILADDPAFDVILCDMMMPRLSGMDLHAWLARENPGLAEQVIFITGGAFTPRAQDYLSKVDNLWLEKPLDVGNFKKIVNDRVRLVKGVKGA